MATLRNHALHILVSALCLVLRENALALAKSVLHFLPYGKSVAVASILITRIPTNDTTKRFYESTRPRWNRSFVFRLNPFCPLSKLFALTGLYQPEITAALLKGPNQGTFVDIGANFGYFSVLWLSKWTGDVLAIEPMPETLEGERDSDLDDFTRFLISNGYRALPTNFDLCYYLPVIERSTDASTYPFSRK